MSLGNGGVSLGQIWVLPPDSVPDLTGNLEKSSFMPTPYDGKRGEDFFLSSLFSCV